jgi:hypothetical protein
MALDIQKGNINNYNFLGELGKGSYGVVHKVSSRAKPDQVYVMKQIDIKHLAYSKQ